jgi:diguanylate cyclase (GGDEF)-like protein/PAS domain S-box-containing protein
LPTEWRISYRRGLWVTVVVGVLCSLALLAGGRRIDASRDQVRDDAAAFAASSALRSQVDVLEGQVRDLGGLFAASHKVEDDEFVAFVRPMLRRSQARSLVYLRDLREPERAAFERRLGHPLRELTLDGKVRIAGQRPRYIVVVHGSFAAAGRSLEGIDVANQPGRLETVERAEREGTLAATGSVALARNGERGTIIFEPVETGGGERGFVAGTFSHEMVFDAVRHAVAPDVALRVTTGSNVVGQTGALPADAEHARLTFGGQAIDLAVAAPQEAGVRIGPLAFGVGLLLTTIALILQTTLRTRRRLAIRDTRLAEAFEASPIGQAVGFRDGHLARVNAALSEITGLSREELGERTSVDLIHPADRERAQDLVARALASPGTAVGGELRLLVAGGAARWAQVHFTRLDDEELGSPLLTQVIDVSERRGLEVELRHQAEHDALTELLNRRGFQRRLGALIEHGASGAVMLIDLDHFKAINDTLGHHVGDQVIRAAGAALRHSLRAEDVVARIGGDEFAVLLPGADHERAQATAQRLVHAVDGMSDGRGVSASVGVAMLDGRFAQADDALMAADLAMYDAKHAGRRRTAFYATGEPSATQSRLQWVDRIRCALAEERLTLFAQPIVDLNNGDVHHEILLRMLDTEGALIAPGEFLPIAEQFGLMGEIDRWVVTHAIAALAGRDLTFEINLSGSSLGSPELLDAIRAALVAGRVDPARIIFEITETAAVTNFEEADAFARDLAGLGCRFALDDFGVGFGSFAYVKHLPFDYLKIDGEFVRHSATSPSDRVILESLIHAARGLGKRTIAEYVADEATVTLLRELGVDMVQGFYIGGPVDLAAVLAAAPAIGSSRSPAAP